MIKLEVMERKLKVLACAGRMPNSERGVAGRSLRQRGQGSKDGHDPECGSWGTVGFMAAET